MQHVPKIAICCSTFRRHDGLRSLLESLGRLVFKDPAPEITVVITNNDTEDAVPRTIADQASNSLPFPVDYLEEEQRGLSFPRNRAIDHVRDSHDYIAFIDDDSTARPDWLQQLLDVMIETGADVVTGPVAPVYETTPPDWIVKGGFFAPKQRTTGQELDRAFTNNVLISTEVLKRTGVRFPPEFALFGSEDTFFFRNMHKKGARILWASDAVVDDEVPTQRATEEWLTMRHRRTGMCTSVQERRLRGSIFAVPLLTAKVIAWMILGTGLYMAGLFKGRATRVRARCWLAWGHGLALGMLGRNYAEYLHER